MRLRSMAGVALAVLCLGALRAPAQPAGITGIAHIALRVSDLDKEVNFLGKLGYEEAFASLAGGQTMQVFIKINDRQFIELYPQTDRAQPLGWMHACYESDDLRALNALYTAHGLNPQPVRKAGAGNLLFTIKDPEDRVTEFTQYMPGSRHSEDRGHHLGVQRVSGLLMGFDLPVTDLDAAKAFYAKLGFDVQPQADGTLRLSVATAPEMRVELHRAQVGDQPQYLFPVPDARKAADLLRSAGLKVHRDKKLVFVRDPDGNLFVLLETGERGLLHSLPWIH